jgi:hypothetical protein
LIDGVVIGDEYCVKIAAVSHAPSTAPLQPVGLVESSVIPGILSNDATPAAPVELQIMPVEEGGALSVKAATLPAILAVEGGVSSTANT